MKLKVHVTNITNQVYWSVAKMAQNEVVKILSPLDAVELPIYLYDSSKEPWNEMSARFDGLSFFSFQRGMRWNGMIH